MAETYYCPHDLPRFAEMGKDRPDLWAKFLDYYNAVFADGALTAREKALDRPGRGARGAVPLLHRRLHPGRLAERGRPRADDRGRPRGLRHPRRGEPRARRADAQRGRQGGDVACRAIPARPLPADPRPRARPRPPAQMARSPRSGVPAFEDVLARHGASPARGARDRGAAGQRRQALQPDLPALPRRRRPRPPRDR